MELWVGAVVLGLLYGIMTTGVYITYRVYDFPDITVDGSFTAGGAAAAALIVAGFHPWLALLAALGVGAISGAVTALIHTRFKINGLLSGILVMTGLYSVNLHLMGRSNIPLLQHDTLFSALDALNPGLAGPLWSVLALLPAMTLFWLAISLLLKTDLGLAMRATGQNPTMARANGQNVDGLIILGLALSNGLVGVAGGLVAQYQGFADVTMGVGTIVVGLASVIIGESALRARSLGGQVLSALVGAVIFRLMIALALYLGLNPVDLKLLTAAFVLLILVLSQRVGKGQVRAPNRAWLAPPRLAWGLAALALAGGLGWWAWGRQTPGGGPESAAQAKPLIAVAQLADNQMLDFTRDGLLAGFRAMGYQDGVNCRLALENAHGDLPTLNLILDKFIKDGARVVVAISTVATQAAIQKIKDRPVVFATVANPFIIQAGSDENHHLPNVTGVYGSVPMGEALKVIRALLPGPLKVGTIWDPSQANSEYNVGNLRQAVADQPGVTLRGATVASSGEVQQAAQSLIHQDVDIFVLPPDHVVYSSLDAILSVARAAKKPVMLSEVERLGDGALAVLGYDYHDSGQQAARLVDRILKGQDPRDIPFERYKILKLGWNLETAASLGLGIPPDLLAQASLIYPPAQGQPGGQTASPAATPDASQAAAAPAPEAAPAASAQPPAPGGKRLAIFYYIDMNIVLDCLRGVQDELRECGVLKEQGVEVTVRSAQGEMTLGQAIAQDLVRQKFDYIVSLSTIALQLSSRFNHAIPQVFGTVTNPYLTGVAKSPSEHQANLTGVATFQPVEAVIRTARQVFPHAKRMGISWNPGELSSEACTLKAREAAARYGFTLVEANVTSPAEVMEAVRGLLAKDIDIFLTSGDSVTISAMDTVAKMLDQARVPLITNACGDVEHGAFLSVGPNYYDVGRRTGALMARVMRGEKPRDLPIEDYVPETLWINQDLAKRYGVSIPPEVRARAANLGQGQ